MNDDFEVNFLYAMSRIDYSTRSRVVGWLVWLVNFPGCIFEKPGEHPSL